MKTFIPESIPLEGVAPSAPKLPARSAALQGAWASRPHRSNPVGGTPTLLDVTSSARTATFRSSRFTAFLALLLPLLALVAQTSLLIAQIPISPGSTVSENFSLLGETAAATLSSGWKVDKNTTVRSVGSYAAALSATERAGGINLATTASNGIYNFGSSVADRAVGGISSGTASKSVNIYVALQNTGVSQVSGFTISYNAERYRNGSNPAGYSIQLYYSTDGISWVSAGADFLSSFAANADNSGSATVPIQTIAVTAKSLPVTLASGSTIYLAWNYSVTSGSTTTNAQALGVSDIQIIALGGTPLPAILASAGFTAFSSITGTASAAQSFTVNGTNLESGILLQAPTGYELSTNNSSFSQNTTLSQTGGNASGTVFARISAAAPTGPISGNITLTSTNATTRTVAVSGSVRPGTVAIPHIQNFETDSEPWFTHSVAGSANWARVSSALGNGSTTNSPANGAMQINGFLSDVAANDWLLIGPFNFSSSSNPAMIFNTLTNFAGNGTLISELSLKVSTNYSGTGDPTSATWTTLNFTKPGPDRFKTNSGLVPLTGAANQNGVYVAFHYIAGGTANGTTALWQVDDVTIGNNLTPPPILTPVTLSGPLSTTAGTPSSAVSFTANGSNLTANITATAQTGFEVSTDSITFAPSVSVAAPATVFIRFSSSRPAGIYNNTISAVLSSANATNVNVTTSATGNTVNATPIPTITPSTAALSGFTTTNGTASAVQSFTVNGTNLTADITAIAPASFEISTDNSTFAPNATFTQTGGNAAGSVFVRLAASAPVGTPSGNITLSSTGATNRLVAISGNVTAPLSSVPVVTAASFNGTIGVAFSANITATNGPNTFSAISALPVGLTLDSTTGAITGTPTAVGNSSVVISAANGNGTGNATISFSIAKGTPTITTPPTATPIRVGQTLSNSTLSGGVASVNGTFAFTTPSTAPIATGNQSVSFTPSDSTNWNTATTNVSVTVNPAPTINVNPTSLTGFSTKQNAASANQTLTVNGTDLEGAVTINASTGYQISTDGVSYSSSLTLSPNQSSAPVARAATIIASDTASNYGNATFNTWGNGSNGGTGFQAWLFNVVNNSGGTPPPVFFAGAFIGDPGTAGITNMPSPAFGLYANPGGTAANASVSRAFAQPMAVGDSFSFQWATNWDSDVGNKGFNIFAGGNQVVNVNQGGFPGNITLNGQVAIPGSGFGTQPMTWTFTCTTATNLLVTSTPRTGGSTIAYSTNVTLSAAPEGFSFYTTAMGQGDQRQPYFNNLQITSSGGSTGGGNLTTTTVFVRLAANGTPGAANGNLTLASANATTRTVTLAGTIIALAPPVITSRTINGTVGSNLTASINATNSPSSHTANGTLPPGVSFNAATGVFSGMPTAIGNYTVAVTATNADGSGTGNLTFAIAKGTPVITTPPTASPIFSDQSLANSVLTGGNATTPGNFTFTNPSAPLTTGNSTYSVTFTPTDSANWNSSTLNVTVQVILRTPPVISSRAINGTVGTPLTASINATNSPTSHTANGTIPPGLTFNATTGVFSGTPSTTGNYTLAVSATNSDGTGSGNLTFAIAKGTPVITTPPVATLIYSGQQLSTSILSGGVASINGTFAFTNPTIIPSVGNASQSVTFTPIDTTNWNTASLNVTVQVSPDPPAPPEVSDSTITATVGQNLSATINATNGPTSYNATTTLPPGLSLDTTTGAITGEPLLAGNFTTAVTATNIKGSDSGNLTFVIGKGTPKIDSPPTARLYTDETLGTAYMALSGGVYTPVLGDDEFVDPTINFPSPGNQTVQVRFTPLDLVNWNPITFNATVTVDPLPNYGNLTLSQNTNELREGDEFSEVRIRIRRPGPLTLNATVNVTESPVGQLRGDKSGNATFLNLPLQVDISTGSNSTTLYVIPKDDSVYTGNRTVTLLFKSRFHGNATQSVTLNIVENEPAPAGFAGWSNNATRTPERIRDYGIGGGPFGQAGELPMLSKNSTHASLAAVIRTEDPKLSIRGEWTNDLKNGPWTPANLSADSNRTGLSTGFERRFFSVPILPGETRKFLRLRVELQD